jgi:peptidoglycan/LPS O-acetylase OafA/YrhL
VPPGLAPALSRWFLHTPLPFSFAAFGVSLFFLISGFVIPLSLNQVSTASFLSARAWRIIPTYVAGFSFTLLALVTSSYAYGKPFPYSISAVMAHLIPGVRAILITPFIDYVIWTLEIEVFFYALCALTAPWLRRGSLLVLIIPTLLLLLVMPQLNVAQYVILGYIPALDFMFVGVLISFHSTGKIGRITGIIAITFVTGSCLIAVYWTQGMLTTSSYAWALAVFGAAYLSRSIFPDLAPLRWLAAISYPFYVVHGIMGYVAMRIMLDHAIPPMAAVLLASALAVLVSIFIHIWVEIPTQLIGKRGLGWIGGSSTQATFDSAALP